MYNIAATTKDSTTHQPGCMAVRNFHTWSSSQCLHTMGWNHGQCEPLPKGCAREVMDQEHGRWDRRQSCTRGHDQEHRRWGSRGTVLVTAMIGYRTVQRGHGEEVSAKSRGHRIGDTRAVGGLKRRPACRCTEGDGPLIHSLYITWYAPIGHLESSV